MDDTSYQHRLFHGDSVVLTGSISLQIVWLDNWYWQVGRLVLIKETFSDCARFFKDARIARVPIILIPSLKRIVLCINVPGIQVWMSLCN